MTDTFSGGQSDQDLTQTAIHCYLSTILATTECIAKVFPNAGVPYHNRWRRLPQRIGFDLSANSLEASGRMFESDLSRFAESASRLLSDGLNLIHKVGAEAAKPFENAVQETASYADLLDGLAESLQEAADLDGSPEVSNMLCVQSEGLRRSVRQLRYRLLPALNTISTLIRECRRVQLQAEQESILDPVTGFVNSRGFRYELKRRYEESHDCCVLLIDCQATLENGQECSDDQFNKIADELAGRVEEQFRPWDCLGRIGPRRLGVIFGGRHTAARDRSEQISRSIGGAYSSGVSLTANIQVMEASDADSLLTVLAMLDKTPAPGQPESNLAVA